jgi:EAL domain-containing protein (putative c-di-GMP-specific phosphodiesterase class I)
VRGITRVAQSLGIRTIAECVESVEIQALLPGLGVDFAQGFAISTPAPLDDRGVTCTTEQTGLLALP